MGKPINLGRVRKARKRDGKAAEATARAAAFGRTKAEREAEAQVKDRAAQALDGHRRDDEGPNDG